MTEAAVIVATGLHPQVRMIDAIKAIRLIAGVPLREAKDIADTLHGGVVTKIRLFSGCGVSLEAACAFLSDNGVVVQGVPPAMAETMLRRQQRELVERLVETLGGWVNWGPVR